jgi:NAD(P)-dependent dehydrogenase (short-subunit alcohol dehydrogenase family)
MSEPPRAALVTGSTSGIGLAIALRLARFGYSVTLNYANDDNRATATLSLCREADPGTRLVKADIGTADGAAALVRQAVEASGRLDVLVDNAARVIDKPALEMTEEDWDRVMDVNLKGAFLCSQHAAQQMLTQDDGGSIVNIGASTGIRGRRNGVSTCASKAGLMIMTQCLALELAPKIRVNAIIPGLFVTEETTRRFDLSNPATRRAGRDCSAAAPGLGRGRRGGGHAHALRRIRFHHRPETGGRRRPEHVVRQRSRWCC